MVVHPTMGPLFAHESLQAPSPKSRRETYRAQALAIARVLEEGRGPMVLALERGEAKDLKEAWARLPQGRRESLERKLGDFLEELTNISQQKNTPRFYRELLHVARSLEQASKGALAYGFYQLLGKESVVDAKTAESARHRLAVLEGQGGFLDHMETMGDHFGAVIFNGPMAGAMLAAPVGKGVGRVLGLGGAYRWGQVGLRAKALKGIGGMAGEILGFTGVSMGLRKLSGEGVGGVGEELERGILFFGGLHAMRRLGLGIHGKIFAGNLHSPLARLSMPVLGQTGMLGGIGIGNYLQTKRGYLKEKAWDAFCGGAAAQWLELNLTGMAVQRTLGRYLKPWETHFEKKIAGMEMRQEGRFKTLGEFWGGIRAKGGEWLNRSAEKLFPHAQKLYPNAVLASDPARSLIFNINECDGRGGYNSFSKLNDLPYLRDKHGKFLLPEPNMTVAVLGDNVGRRTSELALEGHRVIHIDHSPYFLRLSQRHMLKRTEIARRDGTFKGEPNIEWVLRDWYETTAQADFVEAYFPLSPVDVAPRHFPHRTKQLQTFLDRAVNSKLGPQGKGIFLISEDPTMIEDMAKLVRYDPRWKLLEERHESSEWWEGRPFMPIIGGHGFNNTHVEVSWLVYVPKRSL